MLIIDYCLDMFRASGMRIIKRKDHVFLHMGFSCNKRRRGYLLYCLIKPHTNPGKTIRLIPTSSLVAAKTLMK